MKPAFYITTKNQNNINYALLSLSLIALYCTTLINYLLFHTLAELFSIVVAFSMFMIGWHSRHYIKNPYLLVISIAYLFIGFIDLLHTLTYEGMPIFTDYSYYANQLWIGARFLESITLLCAFRFLHTKKMPKANIVFLLYSLITLLLILSIFYWKNFPECFNAANGLTPFKIYSEYTICGILVASMYLLNKNRDKFDYKIYLHLFLSLICTIISELAFTFYISNYGFSNLVGHYFKIFSFFLIYRAVIKTGIEIPYELIFLDLNRTNSKLNEEIEVRKKMEQQREKLITQLENALEEINTLEGIIPICMHCKNIRDDQGYWQRIEQFIQEHSEAEFSHGICPTCLKKHYPQFPFKDEDKEKESLTNPNDTGNRNNENR